MQNGKWTSLALFLILCYGVAFIGGWLTDTTVHTWYTQLNKPAWNPPDWVFGPVWTVLYFMIALSGWIVYSLPASREKNIALGLWGLQLFLNFIWSYFFFYLENPLWALMDITALIAAVSGTILLFKPLSKNAALLLVPYLIWILFAFTLNFAIWILN